MNGKTKEYILQKLKYIKMQDIFAGFLMLAALLVKPFYRKKYVDTWLICEEPKAAKDNGYHFFKYMCEQHPEKRCFYAIKRKSAYYKKVRELGPVIEYGSLQHWIAYFLCEYNISTQKSGKPNAAICLFFELTGKFKIHNVFLQHGVIINDLSKGLAFQTSKFKYFITSTVPETEFIKRNFGYPEEAVQMTGLPRFDALHNAAVDKQQILVMPTWRKWLGDRIAKGEKMETDIESSEYVKQWASLLNSESLMALIERYRLKVFFYPHWNMQPYLSVFQGINPAITIASWDKYEVQDLLKSATMLITDYSSVFFDMVYMKKPIIFYQFDEAMVRKYHLEEGYFDYHNNPFGIWTDSAEKVCIAMEHIISQGYAVSNEYLEEHRKIFTYWDTCNCERVYKLLAK